MDKQMYRVIKVLNNNVVICSVGENQEVIVLAKGIGFGKKPGDQLTDLEKLEKVYTLKDKEEQAQYKALVGQVDENFIAIMNDIVSMIETRFGKRVDEHIHIGLTDHLTFTFKRLEQGMEVTNPFLSETEALYPEEFALAEEIVEFIGAELNFYLPPAEVGFIALHIHSATNFKDVLEVNRHHQLVGLIAGHIEQRLGIKIDRKSLDYKRLIRHLRSAIERVSNGEFLEAPEKVENLLREEYPLCYDTAWELMSIMERQLKKAVPRGEATYLTMHLQRLVQYDSGK